MVLQLLALLVSFATVRLWANVRKLASLTGNETEESGIKFTLT